MQLFALGHIEECPFTAITSAMVEGLKSLHCLYQTYSEMIVAIQQGNAANIGIGARLFPASSVFPGRLP